MIIAVGLNVFHGANISFQPKKYSTATIKLRKTSQSNIIFIVLIFRTLLEYGRLEKL